MTEIEKDERKKDKWKKGRLNEVEKKKNLVGKENIMLY